MGIYFNAMDQIIKSPWYTGGDFMFLYQITF